MALGGELGLDAGAEVEFGFAAPEAGLADAAGDGFCAGTSPGDALAAGVAWAIRSAGPLRWAVAGALLWAVAGALLWAVAGALLWVAGWMVPAAPRPAV